MMLDRSYTPFSWNKVQFFNQCIKLSLTGKSAVSGNLQMQFTELCPESVDSFQKTFPFPIATHGNPTHLTVPPRRSCNQGNKAHFHALRSSLSSLVISTETRHCKKKSTGASSTFRLYLLNFARLPQAPGRTVGRSEGEQGSRKTLFSRKNQVN